MIHSNGEQRTQTLFFGGIGAAAALAIWVWLGRADAILCPDTRARLIVLLLICLGAAGFRIHNNTAIDERGRPLRIAGLCFLVPPVLILLLRTPMPAPARVALLYLGAFLIGDAFMIGALCVVRAVSRTGLQFVSIFTTVGARALLGVGAGLILGQCLLVPLGGRGAAEWAAVILGTIVAAAAMILDPDELRAAPVRPLLTSALPPETDAVRVWVLHATFAATGAVAAALVQDVRWNSHAVFSPSPLVDAVCIAAAAAALALGFWARDEVYRRPQLPYERVARSGFLVAAVAVLTPWWSSVPLAAAAHVMRTAHLSGPWSVALLLFATAAAVLACLAPAGLVIGTHWLFVERLVAGGRPRISLMTSAMSPFFLGIMLALALEPRLTAAVGSSMTVHVWALLLTAFTVTAVNVSAPRRQRSWRSRGIAGVLTVVAIATPGLAVSLRSGINSAALLRYHATASPVNEDHGYVTLVDDGAGHLIVDGVERVSSSAAYARGELFLTALPLLIHPHPQRLVICGMGSGGPAVVARAFYVTDYVIVEPNAVAAHVALDGFTMVNRAEFVLGDLPIVHTNPMRWLRTHPRQVDVIVDLGAAAVSADAAWRDSREYFQLCRQRLRGHGIMARGLRLSQYPPSQWRPLLAAFHDVFPDSQIWRAGDWLILLGSDQPIVLDYDMLKRRASHGFDIKRVLDQCGLIAAAGILGRFRAGSAGWDPWIGKTPPCTLAGRRYYYGAVRRWLHPDTRWDDELPLPSTRLPVITGRFQDELRSIDATYVDAQIAYLDGEPALAKHWCAAVLRQDPHHQGAKELLRTLGEQLDGVV